MKQCVRVALFLAALWPAAAAAGMVENCRHPDDPYVRIGGCTNAIDSGNWFGRDLAWAYYNRGTAFSAIGQPQRAIQDYNRAIDRDPRYVLAFLNRGSAFAAIGDYTRALEDARQAIALNPSLATAYANRGSARAGLGEFEAALDDYDLALTLEPGLTVALYGRGLMHLQLGRAGEAVADFDAVLAAQPGHTEAQWQRAMANNLLAWRAYKEGRADDALALVSDALRWLPETPRVIDTHAHILASLGRTDDALAAFERAMEAGGADRVRAYQATLTQLGYKPGPEAGVYDAGTREALRLCIAAGCALTE